MTFSAFGPIIIATPIIIAAPTIGTDTITTTDVIIFPVQREMESGVSPLMSIPPFGRGFSRHHGFLRARATLA
jgi:hypothetical protein